MKKHKETGTIRDQGDDVEIVMENEEVGDESKQIWENFMEKKEILTPATRERIEETERLVKPKTKIREEIRKNSPKLKKKINKVAGNQILRKLEGKMNKLQQQAKKSSM